MILRTTSTPFEDIEFLARSEHRITALTALARRPQTRTDLRTMTGVSRSTIGRTLRAFEERHWIRRDGHHYEATQLGAFIAVGIQELLDRLNTEQTLREIWEYLPDEASGFSIEMISDAVVTVAKADNPYRPVHRFKSLLRETDRFRFVGFNLALLDPCTDELCQRIIDGMQAEVIDPPSVVNHIRSTYPEQFSETFESGNLTVWVHDDLPPYGVGIFDDRAAVSGYDPDSGTVQMVIDTDAPVAREWAESIFTFYRDKTPTIGIEAEREDTPLVPQTE